MRQRPGPARRPPMRRENPRAGSTDRAPGPGLCAQTGQGLCEPRQRVGPLQAFSHTCRGPALDSQDSLWEGSIWVWADGSGFGLTARGCDQDLARGLMPGSGHGGGCQDAHGGSGTRTWSGAVAPDPASRIRAAGRRRRRPGDPHQGGPAARRHGGLRTAAARGSATAGATVAQGSKPFALRVEAIRVQGSMPYGVPVIAAAQRARSARSTQNKSAVCGVVDRTRTPYTAPASQ
jgi:hypothetical protein